MNVHWSKNETILRYYSIQTLLSIVCFVDKPFLKKMKMQDKIVNFIRYRERAEIMMMVMIKMMMMICKQYEYLSQCEVIDYAIGDEDILSRTIYSQLKILQI